MTRSRAHSNSTGVLQKSFSSALDALAEQVKLDRSILAAILCGSLSHDMVWARSDIDLVLITIDDKKVERGMMTLYADGVNVHAILLPRAEFRRLLEGTVRNSFMHSFIAKGRLLYTHDETIAGMLERLGELGDRDTQLQLFRAASEAIPLVYKAHKFLHTRGDLEYTAMWILHAAEPLARVEVVGAFELAGREVIQQALPINPAFFKAIYTDLLNEKKSASKVKAALKLVDDYLEQRAPALFAPVVDYLAQAGEARSSTEIEDHFTRTYGIPGVVIVCEYLADIGLIGKASTTTRLTKRSTADVQELAFYSI